MVHFLRLGTLTIWYGFCNRSYTSTLSINHYDCIAHVGKHFFVLSSKNIW